jgi:putative MATE family efflux protein
VAEKTAQENSRDLTEGNVLKHLVFFSIPLLLGNVLQSFNQLIDAFWVGRFVGSDALAAVAVSGPVVFVLLSFVFGFVIATSTMVAQYKGAKDQEALQKTIDSSVKALTLSAFVLTVMAIILAPYVLRILQTPDEIFAMAHQYLAIFFGGILFIGGFNYLSAVLRGLGDSKTPLYFLIVSTVLNVLFSPLLIVGFGPIPALEVAGAALATVFSQGIAFILGVLYIKRKKLGFFLRLIKGKVEMTYLKKMITLGIPAGMQQVIVSTAVVVVMGAVNMQGADTVAGFGLATRLDGLIFLPGLTLGMAVAAMVGQNIGAGKWERVPLIVRSGILIAFLITGTLSLLLFIFRVEALTFFTSDPNVIAEGEAYLKIVVFTFIPFSFMFIISGALRGAGDMVWGMILTVLSLWVIRVPLVYVLAHFMGAEGIWYGMAISFVSAYLVAGLYYLTGNWKKKALVTHEPSAQTVEGQAV